MKLSHPAVCIALLLTACGGSNGADGDSMMTPTTPVIVPPSVTPILPPPSNPFDFSDGAIAAKFLTPSDNTVASVDGSVTSGAFVVGDLAGQLNSTSTLGTITGGGGVTLTASDTEFVGLFDAAPQGSPRSVGVVGLATPAGDLPSGSLRYSGSTHVTIIDGVDLYDLSGDVTVEAVLTGSPSLTTTLNGLNGSRTDTVSDAVNVRDVASITITGSALEGAAFTNGSVEMTSDSVTALTSGATVALQGGFYGPEGEEVGGVGSIDDTVDVAFDFIGRR